MGETESVQNASVEAVPRVSLVGLLEPEGYPDPDAKRMAAEEEDATYGGELIAHDLFDRMCVLHGAEPSVSLSLTVVYVCGWLQSFRFRSLAHLRRKSNCASKLVVLLVDLCINRFRVSQTVGEVETHVIEHVRGCKSEKQALHCGVGGGKV